MLNEIEEFLDAQVVLVEHDKRLVVVLFLIRLRRGQPIRYQFFSTNEREKYLIDRQAFIFRQFRQPPHFDNSTSFDVQTSGCHQTVDESMFIACIEQQREVRAESMLDVILNRSRAVVSSLPGWTMGRGTHFTDGLFRMFRVIVDQLLYDLFRFCGCWSSALVTDSALRGLFYQIFEDQSIEVCLHLTRLERQRIHRRFHLTLVKEVDQIVETASLQILVVVLHRRMLDISSDFLLAQVKKLLGCDRRLNDLTDNEHIMEADDTVRWQVFVRRFHLIAIDVSEVMIDQP